MASRSIERNRHRCSLDDEGPASRNKRCRVSAESDGDGGRNDEGLDGPNPPPPRLASLPPDALVSILCRVPSEDHGALWRTCRAFRETIDSEGYCSERASSGWAEVSTRLVPKEELWVRDGSRNDPIHDPESDEYDAEESRRQRQRDLETRYSRLGRFDGTYHWHDCVVDVKVDGIVSGKIKLVIIPRRRWNRAFHEATDAHSRKLQQVGWFLCDNSGRPRVRSVREADLDGSAKRGGFLHIVSVRVRAACRPSGGTDVVARALRMALCSPELDGEWTLATALSDPEVYFTREDEELSRNVERNSIVNPFHDDTEDTTTREDGHNFDVRWKECRNLDARTFLRVGFRQIPEAVGPEDGQAFWFFALPRFFADGDILTHNEALSMPLHECPELPSPPEGVNKELLAFVVTACSQRSKNGPRAIFERKKRRLVQEQSRSEQSLAASFERLEGMQQKIETAQQLLNSVQNIQLENDAAPAESRLRSERRSFIITTRAQISEFRAQAAKMHSELEVARSILQRAHSEFEKFCASKEEFCAESQEEMEKMDQEFVDGVTRFVQDEGASIRKSFALHCSAKHFISHYLNALLQLVPSCKRVDAINDLDMNGSSPLMCAVSCLPEVFKADQQLSFVEELLSLGADTSIVNPATGTTALGCYRSSVRSNDDFAHVFSSVDTEAWSPIHTRMEETLMPAQGESNADRDAKRPLDDHSSDDDDDGDGDDDEDDGDDDDGSGNEGSASEGEGGDVGIEGNGDGESASSDEEEE